MSHSLAKKFDKIVSKLGSKNKEPKSNTHDTNNDGQQQQQANSHEENNSNEANNESTNESISQKIKGHFGHAHAHGSNNEGAPPVQIIINDLKDSPFKGKVRW